MKRTLTFSLIVAALAAVGIFRTLRASAPQVPSNAWAVTGALTHARAGASATLLIDGRVLVAGGLDDAGVTASVDRYSALAGGFIAATPMQQARANHSATLLQDGRVLVVGGVGADGHATNSAEIYDASDNVWQSAGSLSFARSGHTATLLADGRVLVGGGDNGGVPIAELEVFDPSVGVFTLVDATLSVARTGHAAALAGGKVLFIGGFDGMHAVAATDVFDPETNSMSAGASLGQARAGHSATTLLDGKVLVAGGASDTAELASAELFDPATSTFVPAGGALAAARQHHLAILLPHNNSVLFVGGSAAGNAVGTAELYVPWEGAGGSFVATTAPSAARTWTAGSALSFAASDTIRTGPADGLLLLAGGSATATAASPLASAELYGFATIKTDASDYGPGATVTITGSGWQPGEWVTLMMVESPNIDTHALLPVQADESGNIVSTEFSPDEHDIDVRFYLTAIGQYSQAQTTFTDAGTATLSSVTVGAQSGPVTYGTAGSATFTVTTTRTSTGNQTADLSLNGALPSGVTASFTPSTVNFGPGGGNNSPTATLTFTTTSATPAGNYSFTVSAVGSNTVTSSSFTFTVAKKTLTPSIAAANKVYDGTTTEPVASITCSLAGVVSGDSVTCAPTSAAFADKNVGVGKTVTATGIALSGAAAGNYALSTTTRTAAANITARAITVTAAANTKPYDATASATASPTVTSGSIQAGDTASFTETYDNKNVGTSKTLTPAGTVNDGNSGSNYSFTFVATSNGTITAKHVTGSLTAGNKEYDGGTSATVLTRAPGAIIAGDVVTLTGGTAAFDTKSVGTGKTVTLTGATLTGTDAGNYILDSVATTTADITAKHVTGSFTASDKPYDGTTAATVLTRTPGAIVGGDAVTLDGGTATFDTKNVGTGKTVTLTGASLTGADAANYVLDGVATTTANITAKHVTGSFTASDKAYDGTTTATVLTRTPGAIVGGDAVTLTGGTASFDTKTVGTGKTVTLTGASLTGADAGNYLLDAVATTTANITAKHVTGSFTASDKPYDGTTAATVLTRAPGAIVGGDAVTLDGGTATFDTKSVGTGKTVTLTGASLAGADSGNYVLDSVETTTANITAKHVTGSFTASDKPYDGTTAATVLTRSPGAIVGGDAVTLDGGTATFDTKSVGTAKTVTLTGATLAGADAGNYVLDSVATATANITAKHVIGSFTASNKEYDGTTSATVLTRSPGAIVGGDAVTLDGGTATFDTKSAGTGKTVTLTGASLVGADAGNYALDAVSTTTANITAKHVTGSFTASHKQYDGTTSATVLTRAPGAVIDGDAVSLTGGTATFDTKTVGMGKTVTLSGASVTGADAGNYVLDSVTTTTANITALHVTGSFTADNKPYDGNTTATVLTRSPGAVVGGDAVSLTGGTAAFDTKNVGTGKTVTLTGASLTGGDAGNYVLDGVSTTTANITARHVTGSFTAQNKPYDGNIAATVLTRSPGAIVGGDAVTLDGGTATFDTKSAGTGKTVTLTGASLVGADAGNYALDAVSTTTADITALHVTGSFTAQNKVYDGNMAATVLTRAPGAVIGGDVVSLSGGTATFDTKTVGTGKIVTLSGATLAGADAANYVLDGVSTTTANITALHVTGSFTADNKPYDGNATATVLTRSPGAVVGGDAVSLTGGTAAFDTKSVGTGKTVTLVGASLTGADAGNYVLDSVSTTTANITALHVTGSFTAENKPYDGNVTATVLTRSPGAIVGGDAVSLTGGTATFDTKNVGIGKTVTLAGASLTGSDATNYVLDGVATTTADITALHVTGGFTAQNRVYDGNTTAIVLTRVPGAVIDGDAVSLTGGAATFDTRSVGTGKTVTLTGAILTGADAANYVLDGVATTTADITVLHVTGSFTAQSKGYDGNAAATVLTRSPGAVIGGDAVSLTGGTASFDSSSVGTAKTVTLTGASLSDADAGNYVLDGVATSIADITGRHVTGSFTAQNKPYDGNTAATVLTRSPGAVVSGDAVSLAGGTATFDTKDVGNGKTVTLTGASLSGAAAGNYVLDGVATTTADISGIALTATVAANSRPYDGTAAATLNSCSFAGVVSGDSVSCNTIGYSASFANASAGTGKAVTATGLSKSGSDAGNYSFNGTGSGSANIIARDLHVTATADSRIYDATTAAVAHLADDRIAGDSFTESYTTASFADANVGAGKTVAVSGITIAGGVSGNYNLVNTTATASASITVASTTITITNAASLASSPTLTGDSYIVTWSMVVNSPGAGTPTGTVTVSGDSSCSAPVAAGQCAVTSTTAGTKTLVATYTSDTANFSGSVSAGASHTVNPAVVYDLLGLFDPYAPPAQRSFKAGSTIPLKWQYTKDSVLFDSATNTPAVSVYGPVACGDSTGGATVAIADAGASGLRYDSTSKTWQFNWKTANSLKDCYYVEISNTSLGVTKTFPVKMAR